MGQIHQDVSRNCIILTFFEIIDSKAETKSDKNKLEARKTLQTKVDKEDFVGFKFCLQTINFTMISLPKWLNCFMHVKKNTCPTIFVSFFCHKQIPSFENESFVSANGYS